LVETVLTGVAFAAVPHPYRSPYGSDPSTCARACALDLERASRLLPRGHRLSLDGPE